ncbi:MAG: outer membrane protein assembly factor, partial [Gammaproteobacteria bacterium]
MCRLMQCLLVIFAGLYCSTLIAQIKLSVDVSGVDVAIEKNVRLYLSIEQQKDNPLLTPERLRRLHHKAQQEISNALQPYGYYRPRIISDLSQTESEHWFATYIIEPGPPIPISEFKLVISEPLQQDPALTKLLEDLPLKIGKPFNHLDYESIKNSLAKTAAERGYFRAQFVEHRVEIDLASYQARIFLNYDGGPRYRFGEVQLEQDVLDSALLQRYIHFKRGDPYNLNDLIDLQQALNDSDYFETAEVSPGEISSDSEEVPVQVVLTPRKRHRFTVGLGYGTDTGTRAKFGWEIPRLNREGHRFNTEARVSEIGYNTSVRYRIPILNPRTDQLIYFASVDNEKTDTSDSTVRTIGASINRSRGLWRESISLNYQQEDYVVADDEGDSTLLIPGISWNRTWGNEFIHVLDGLRFDISLRGATTELISDTDFIQLHGGLKGITSINESNRIIARGRLGSTFTDEFHLLPSSLRFFAGGSQSVRGYAYESLGPVDENGEVVGG